LRHLAPLVYVVAPAALLATPSARAQATSGTVVLLVEDRAAPLSRRLQQEIESLGLTVRIIAEGDALASQREIGARVPGAIATVRVGSGDAGVVELSMIDRATGKVFARRLVVATPDEPLTIELVATRTVELLRAALIDVPSPPPPAPPKATPQRDADAPAPLAHEQATPTRSATLSLLGGPALLYRAGFRPGAHVAATLTYMSSARVGVSAAALIPVLPARLTGEEGDVEVSATSYRLSGVAEVLPPSWPVGLRLSLGVALNRLYVAGAAHSPYLAADEHVVTWSPVAATGLRLPLGSAVSVAAEAAAFIDYPRTVVRLAGREAATWGRPTLVGSLGLEIAWPGGGSTTTAPSRSTGAWP